MFTTFGVVSSLPKKFSKRKCLFGYSKRFILFILVVCDSFGLASLAAPFPCVLGLNDPASFCVRLLALEQVISTDGNSFL